MFENKIWRSIICGAVLDVEKRQWRIMYTKELCKIKKLSFIIHIKAKDWMVWTAEKRKTESEQLHNGDRDRFKRTYVSPISPLLYLEIFIIFHLNIWYVICMAFYFAVNQHFNEKCWRNVSLTFLPVFKYM